MVIKNAIVSVVLITIAILTVGMSRYGDTAGHENNSVAVVELFTSQGCSSCPSADKLLSEIVDKADKDNSSIIGLSFHVTYWNRLGWTDPFSKEEFTKRQRIYGSKFGNNTIYTPQMIVNGKYEFVGSSRSKSNEAINRALGQSPGCQISLDIKEITEDGIRIDFKSQGADANALMNFAIVERDLTNYVPRGENRGLTLSHDNVVRAFKSINAVPNGTVDINIDTKILKKSKCAIVAYAQDRSSFEIYGATKMDLTI